MLWTIIVILLVLWLLGLLVHIGGNLIHILLVIALIILILNLFKANEDFKRDNKIDSPLFDIALVLMRFDHVASRIVNTNHAII